MAYHDKPWHQDADLVITLLSLSQTASFDKEHSVGAFSINGPTVWQLVGAQKHDLNNTKNDLEMIALLSALNSITRQDQVNLKKDAEKKGELIHIIVNTASYSFNHALKLFNSHPGAVADTVNPAYVARLVEALKEFEEVGYTLEPVLVRRDFIPMKVVWRFVMKTLHIQLNKEMPTQFASGDSRAFKIPDTWLAAMEAEQEVNA
jgi:hypothetical protein